MPRLQSLKSATSLSDLATLLAFKPKAVAYILYKESAATKYNTFEIPKRGGGHRTIKAPIDSLKLLQRRLSDLLQDCVDEIRVATNRKDRAAHGFKRKRSIITNARQHRRRRWVFNLDLEDFFPSINFGRVRGFFIKNRDFQLHEDVATAIAQIACHDNSLPQGSPCSPVISNLVAHLLDMRLVDLASQFGCTYSRYADDLTFSTNKKALPPAIAVPSGTEGAAAHSWVPGTALQRIIERTGFRINAKKTHLMYRGSRQAVTGLVVNEKLSVRWEYRHNVRAMVHRLVTTGEFEVLGVRQQDGRAVLEMRPGSQAELHGMLGFIDSIDHYNKIYTSASASRSGSAKREQTYRRFLIYSHFYAAPEPVIVCEGETDNIYLTHAIRSLVAEYPALAEVTPPKNTIRLKVRLYKYPRSSTARLLGLKDGGSGSLAKFIAAYKKETDSFTGPGLTSPVIILYDNDEGAGPVRNTIKEISKVAPPNGAPFVRIVRNMYAVPTTGADSKIEHFFDATTLGTVLGGKTFNAANDTDTETQYGKKIFARKVVQAKATTINFQGFRPLLTNLVGAIQSHQASVAAQPPGAPTGTKAGRAKAAAAKAGGASAAPAKTAPAKTAPAKTAPAKTAPANVTTPGKVTAGRVGSAKARPARTKPKPKRKAKE